eukprot:6295669-Amphidinium_carterae.1
MIARNDCVATCRPSEVSWKDESSKSHFERLLLKRSTCVVLQHSAAHVFGESPTIADIELKRK